MRDVVEFRTGPDGSVVLAPTPASAGGDADYAQDDIEVELSGSTIHLAVPGEAVGLEVVHGESIDR